jgi:hypothetical protein
MSIVDGVMIGGWTTAVAMIGFCALHESGKLLKIRIRIAFWLETAANLVRPRAESLQPERENLA